MTGHVFDCDPSTRGSGTVHGGGQTPRARDLVEFKPDLAGLAAWTAEIARSRREYQSVPNLMGSSMLHRTEQAQYRRWGV